MFIYNQILNPMKKIIYCFLLLLFFSNFPFFLTKIVAQTDVIAFDGKKIIYVDTEKQIGTARANGA